MTETEKIKLILDGCLFIDTRQNFLFVSRPKDKIFDSIECWLFSGIEKTEPLGALSFEGLTAVFKISMFETNTTFRTKSRNIVILEQKADFLNLTKDEKKAARLRAAYELINSTKF